MASNWEDKFRRWAAPPSETEEKRCKNAEDAIRKAIQKSSKLSARSITVFSQGSYRNNTNVRQDSDVDVGILCPDTFFYAELPAGTQPSTFNITPASYDYSVFKNEVGEALRDYFGVAAVTRGNKAFDIKETSHHVEADVAPFFEHRRYNADGGYISGVELRPDNGVPARVINWPEQHYKNGVSKNLDTGRRYKAMVRVLKNLRNEMDEAGIQEAKSIIGFLSECLVWNVPNSSFGNSTYTEDLRRVLAHLYNQTKGDGSCSEWGEVSELKYLFRGSQKWTRQQANDFLLAAWRYVGF